MPDIDSIEGGLVRVTPDDATSESSDHLGAFEAAADTSPAPQPPRLQDLPAETHYSIARYVSESGRTNLDSLGATSHQFKKVINIYDKHQQVLAVNRWNTEFHTGALDPLDPKFPEAMARVAPSLPHLPPEHVENLIAAFKRAPANAVPPEHMESLIAAFRQAPANAVPNRSWTAIASLHDKLTATQQNSLIVLLPNRVRAALLSANHM